MGTKEAATEKQMICASHAISCQQFMKDRCHEVYRACISTHSCAYSAGGMIGSPENPRSISGIVKLLLETIPSHLGTPRMKALALHIFENIIRKVYVRATENRSSARKRCLF